MLWAGLPEAAGAAPRSLGQEAACGVRAERAPNASNTVCGVCAPEAQELGQLRKCPMGMTGLALARAQAAKALCPAGKARFFLEGEGAEGALAESAWAGASEEVHTVSCWETRRPKRVEGFEKYFSDTLGAKR